MGAGPAPYRRRFEFWPGAHRGPPVTARLRRRPHPTPEGGVQGRWCSRPSTLTADPGRCPRRKTVTRVRGTFPSRTNPVMRTTRGSVLVSYVSTFYVDGRHASFPSCAVSLLMKQGLKPGLLAAGRLRVARFGSGGRWSILPLRLGRVPDSPSTGRFNFDRQRHWPARRGTSTQADDWIVSQFSRGHYSLDISKPVRTAQGPICLP